MWLLRCIMYMNTVLASIMRMVSGHLKENYKAQKAL